MSFGISYPPIPIFELGPLTLSLHGLFAGLGFVAGAALMIREAKRRGFDTDKITSVLTWALVASLLGARFFTVPAHLGDPGYGISDALSIAGDYSILGGYAGGIIGGMVRMRMLGLRIPVTLDMAAAGLALGAVIGRIGDLAIVEHLGSPTTFFLGYTIKPGYDVAPQHDALECTVGQAVNGICGTYHHTGLYDLIGAAVLLATVLWLRKAWAGRRYGQLFSVWVMWYGVQRFLIDFTRLEAAKTGTVADSVMGPFTGSQWGALGGAVIGLLLFVTWRRNPVVSAEQDAEYRGDNVTDVTAETATDGGVTGDGEPEVGDLRDAIEVGDPLEAADE